MKQSPASRWRLLLSRPEIKSIMWQGICRKTGSNMEFFWTPEELKELFHAQMAMSPTHLFLCFE
jgi:hypothetical protein